MKSLAPILWMLGLVINAGAQTLQWDANPPEEGVTNYTVYYGLESRIYTWSEDVGQLLSKSLPPHDGRLYVSVTAWANGIESDWSEEVMHNAYRPPMQPLRLVVSQATNAAGPWTVFFESVMPTNDPIRFFKTEIRR